MKCETSHLEFHFEDERKWIFLQIQAIGVMLRLSYRLYDLHMETLVDRKCRTDSFSKQYRILFARRGWKHSRKWKSAALSEPASSSASNAIRREGESANSPFEILNRTHWTYFESIMKFSKESSFTSSLSRGKQFEEINTLKWLFSIRGLDLVELILFMLLRADFNNSIELGLEAQAHTWRIMQYVWRVRRMEEEKR
jgi:hypothetical protein